MKSGRSEGADQDLPEQASRLLVGPEEPSQTYQDKQDETW